jgi:RimJ/RimL family protein N-acetyltransferase
MIIGERIRFRGIEREDVPTFVKWLNDPEVQQGILIHAPISRAWEENWFDSMIKRPTDEQVMGIEVRSTSPGENEASWKLIGSLGFHEIDWRNRMAEFGIIIGDKAYWNKGYGTEAVRLLVKHGFTTLNLNRIFLEVFETNPRAIRAYEKAGFTHEGKKRQAEFRHGEYTNTLVMSILKDEYLKNQS